MLCTSSSYCYIICCDLQSNTDSDHNQLITSCDLYLFKLEESMLMLIKQMNWKSEEYDVKVKCL